jgi:hypothetical protein
VRTLLAAPAERALGARLGGPGANATVSQSVSYDAFGLAGTPKPSFWFGIVPRRKDLRPIETYRCPACGYLESYAR